MTKTLKRIIAVCFCVVLSFSCISVSAEKKELHFNLQMDTVEATPGNTVTLALNIEDNPGIAAMSFTVHYDASVLEYVEYVEGIFPQDTINAQNGCVRVVYVGRQNKTGDGALCGFRFKIKRNARAGLSAVTLKHIDYKKKGDSLSNCFANLALDTLVANFTSGGIDVGYTLTNHTHELSDWQTVIEPDCEKDGIKSRTCKNCKYSEEAKAQKLEHKYDEKWTVDIAADKENYGTASRHCLNAPCDSKIDEKEFSLAKAEKCGFKNEIGASIKAEDWAIEEQQKENKEPPKNSSSDEETQIKIPKHEETQNKSPKDENETSQELLEEVIKQEESEKTEKTFFEKLSEYLLGTENKGLFELIFGKSIEGHLESVWSLILKLILVIF